MATTFEKSNEWGGYRIAREASGFVLDYHTHMTDEPDGMRILIPYGAWGFYRETDLDADYDDTESRGEKLADLALEDAEVCVENCTVKVLARGIAFH
jgi:hypothetical protein